MVELLNQHTQPLISQPPNLLGNVVELNQQELDQVHRVQLTVLIARLGDVVPLLMVTNWLLLVTTYQSVTIGHWLPPFLIFNNLN